MDAVPKSAPFGVASNDAGPLDSTSAGLPSDIGQSSATQTVDAELRERELLGRALSLAHMGTWHYDEASARLIWSQKTHEIVGLSEHELDGKRENFLAFVLPEDRSRVEEATQRALASPGVPCEVEYRIRRPDGSVRWLFERGSVELGENGLPVRRLGVVMDITKRKHAAEERLQRLARVTKARNLADEASHYYRSLFESAPGCYLVLNPEDCTIVAVSETYLRFTNTTRQKLAGARFFDAFPDDPDDPEASGVEAVGASIRRVRQSGRADVIAVQRYPIRRPEAQGGGFEERFWSLVNSPLRGPDGELAYIIHRMEDVTEYVQLRRHTSPASGIFSFLESRAQFLEADILQRSLELQRAYEQQERDQASLRIAGRVARLGGWSVEFPKGEMLWSDETAVIHDESPGFSPPVDRMMEYYLPEYRDRTYGAFSACVDQGKPFDVEAQIRTARGRVVWVRVIGEALRNASDEIVRVQGACLDISEQKSTSDEINALSSRLQDTLETIIDGFFTLDAQWRFTFLNRAAEQLLGASRAELLGRSLWSDLDHATPTQSYLEYHRAVAEQVPVSFEEYHASLNRWLHTRAYPSRDGIAVYIRDVGVERAVRESIRASEERFRLLIKATNGAVWDWNLAEDTLWWNDGFTALFGYEIDEEEHGIEARLRYVHPDDYERVKGSVAAALIDGSETWTSQYRFRCRSGVFAFVQDQGHILRNSAGHAVRMIGGMTDVTEGRRSDEKSRDQVTLLNQANDAILLVDLEHAIVFWNKAAERLYGWSASDVEGRKLSDLLHPDPGAFLDAAATTLERGEWSGELTQCRRDGTAVLVEARWALIRDDDGAPKSLLSINTDITAKRRAEAHAMRAQRMQSIGALAGGIAHDLNNTLSPILMTVSLLQSDEQDPQRSDDLATIALSARRAASMVRQLVSFARGTEGVRESFDVGNVVADVQKMARDTFPKDIVFVVDRQPGGAVVCADRTQMHQLLTNLCINARDAMPSGGTLTVGVKRVQIDAAYVAQTSGARIGHFVQISVTDTGIGMSPAMIDRIFEPFFTTKEVDKGSGLGLATVHSIVRSHSGFVHVYSELGNGTRFRVYLPEDLASAATARLRQFTAPFDAVLPCGKGELILVVDDEEALRMLAQRTLRKFGYEVVVACNGLEAMEIYKARRNEIALVFTDMSMPVMNGIATIEALYAENPAVRIIVSTGLSATDDIARARKAGVRHFVPKPYPLDSLLAVLREALDDGT